MNGTRKPIKKLTGNFFSALIHQMLLTLKKHHAYRWLRFSTEAIGVEVK